VSLEELGALQDLLDLNQAAQVAPLCDHTGQEASKREEKVEGFRMRQNESFPFGATIKQALCASDRSVFLSQLRLLLHR